MLQKSAGFAAALTALLQIIGLWIGKRRLIKNISSQTSCNPGFIDQWYIQYIHEQNNLLQKRCFYIITNYIIDDNVPEWLRGETRNLLGLPAQVRILSLSFFINIIKRSKPNDFKFLKINNTLVHGNGALPFIFIKIINIL